MKLLYIEDNRINALLFEQALQVNPGFDLHIAEDVHRAVEIIKSWQPDLMIIDAHLPYMSGYETLITLRKIYPSLIDTPAFMCSADYSAEEVEYALKVGFLNYWSKPLNLALVFQDLEKVRQHIS